MTGVPFIQNYTPQDYKANSQNWAVIQDQRGVMYFGNSDGVLEYDGISWRLIQTTGKSVVRSLAIDTANQIYVGAYGEFGVLAPDSLSQLRYNSLLPYLDEEYHDFSDVWQTLVTTHGVYFVTHKYIFRWANQQIRAWKAETAFHIGSLTDNQFYVRQWVTGLMKMVSDSLVVVPDGEKFGRIRITARLPYSGQDSSGNTRDLTLFVTQAQGLFLYDGISAVPFPTPVDDLLKKAQLYHGVQLPNGNYAFATIQNGIIIIDKNGNLRHHLNKENGLQDETVWFLHVDNQGGLWAGMNSGISRIEISAPFTQFSEREGVEGGVSAIQRHNGRLYIATSRGVYYLTRHPDVADGRGNRQFPGRFKRVTGIPPQCWSLLPFGETLLGGTFEGIYEIRGEQAREINRGYTFYLTRSRQDSNRVFAGLQDGMMSLYYAGSQWHFEGDIEGIDQEIRDILETPDGKLWLTTRYQGLLQVNFSGGFTLQPQVTHYDTLHGLPPGDRITAFMTDQGIRFATPQGIYRFDKSRQQFSADLSLITNFPKTQPLIFSAAEDRGKNLWLVGTESLKSGVARFQPDGTFLWEETPFRRMGDIQTYLAYPDPRQNGVIWFGCVDRVIRYDASIAANYALNYKTFIRQVIVNGDSIIYGGATDSASHLAMPVLDYSNNSLRFRYASPSFDDESKNEYQYFLKGYDNRWSSWSGESQKDYTNLPEGNYRFQVRAKNIYQHVSATAVYDFKILPPFYRTWWAYFSYFLAIIGILYFLRQTEIKKISLRHSQELKHLEYEKLKELDQQKSRFFANISHEFRTPLSLILGPVEKTLTSSGEQLSKKELQLIRYNANSLLRLINQVLDLAKLESGKLQLQVRQGDIARFLKAVTMVFESQAARKQIMLRFNAAEKTINAWFDRRKLEDLLYNLLSNAIKFTPQGGEIEVAAAVGNGSRNDLGMEISASGEETKPRISEFIEITIKDSGIGIPEEQLAHIFERFYQVNIPGREAYNGTGIGLMLVKELAELHRGTINIESEEGAGTTVTIRLPRDKSHFAPEEISYLTMELSDVAFSEVVENAEAASVTGNDVEGIPAAAPSTSQKDDTIILIIEDNTELRAFIREQFDQHYKVLEARDGAEGIAKARKAIPDLVISDITMPEKDGYQVCAALKKDIRTSHIPIILLTAKAADEERLKGLETGADAYMTKPFSFAELAVQARNLIAVRRKLRQRFSEQVILKPSELAVSATDKVFLEQLLAVVEKHLGEEKLTADNLAREVAMSRSQIHRKLKALTNQNCEQFILSVRLQRAAELLRQKAASVSEIAYQTGFSSPNYFARRFKAQFGCPPSEYTG